MSTAFRIALDGTQAGHPSSTAKGIGTAIYNPATNILSYTIFVTGIDFNGTQTPAVDDNFTDMHFHNDNVSPPANIVYVMLSDPDLVISLQPDASWKITGSWNAVSNPWDTQFGSATVGFTSDIYLNIHTVEFLSGEIQGNLVCIATDAGETVNGTGQKDILPGLGGKDVIKGFGGADVITGGAAKDTLNGGGAADIFDYNLATESKGANADTIQGFSHAQHDRIDLRTIDAVPGGQNNAFKFIGTQTFAAYNATHNGGVVRAVAGLVQVDIGGNNSVDMTIKTPGATLVGGDFFL